MGFCLLYRYLPIKFLFKQFLDVLFREMQLKRRKKKKILVKLNQGKKRDELRTLTTFLKKSSLIVLKTHGFWDLPRKNVLF